MKKLSFDFDKEFKYSHRNDFGEGNVHYLFSAGQFLFWVDTQDGVIRSIAPTLREELDTWEGEKISENQYQSHLNDVVILNNSYVPRIQVIINVWRCVTSL